MECTSLGSARNSDFVKIENAKTMQPKSKALDAIDQSVMVLTDNYGALRDRLDQVLIRMNGGNMDDCQVKQNNPPAEPGVLGSIGHSVHTLELIFTDLESLVSRLERI
jgi:hypothetical protein